MTFKSLVHQNSSGGSRFADPPDEEASELSFDGLFA